MRYCELSAASNRYRRLSLGSKVVPLQKYNLMPGTGKSVKFKAWQSDMLPRRLYRISINFAGKTDYLRTSVGIGAQRQHDHDQT